MINTLNQLKHKLKTRNENGFTLVELLIVIVIIAILTAIAIIVFGNQQEEAIKATVKEEVRNNASGTALIAGMKPTTTPDVLITPNGNIITATLDGNNMDYLIRGSNPAIAGWGWCLDSKVGVPNECDPAASEDDDEADGMCPWGAVSFAPPEITDPSACGARFEYFSIFDSDSAWNNGDYDILNDAAASRTDLEARDRACSSEYYMGEAWFEWVPNMVGGEWQGMTTVPVSAPVGPFEVQPMNVDHDGLTCLVF